MLKTIRQTLWALRYALRVHPILVLSSFTLLTVLSFLPSAQMFLIAAITDSLSTGDTHAALTWAGVTGGVLAGNLALQQVSNSLDMSLRAGMAQTGIRAIARRLASLTPEQISRGSFSRRSRAAQDAVANGHLHTQVTSTGVLLFTFLMVGSLCVMVARVSSAAAVCLLLCLIPVAFVAGLYTRRNEQTWDNIYAHNHRAWYATNQIAYPNTAEELSTLKAGWFFAARANRQRGLAADEEVKLTAYALRLQVISGVMCAVFLVGALGFLVSSGASAGIISGAIVGALSAMMSLTAASHDMSSLGAGANGITRYREFLEGSENPSRKVAASLDAPLSRVHIENLSITYPTAEKPVVRGVSFEIERGQTIALVGANGAGKTTLIHGILGMLTAHEGRVLFDNTPVDALDPVERHQLATILTQDFGRYELTIRQNLLMGISGRSATDEQLWDALDKARAAEFVRALPAGLDTQLGEQWGGVGLSGGQWQRLALARLILRNTDLWVLDEPTSAIDAETEEDIFASLREIAAGHMTILVSHRAWTLRHADRIYVMDAGAIVESGTYTELMARNSHFAQLFASQTG